MDQAEEIAAKLAEDYMGGTAGSLLARDVAAALREYAAEKVREERERWIKLVGTVRYLLGQTTSQHLSMQQCPCKVCCADRLLRAAQIREGEK